MQHPKSSANVADCSPGMIGFGDAVIGPRDNFNAQLCIPNWRERASSFETLAEPI